jgi:hypothetical protein
MVTPGETGDGEIDHSSLVPSAAAEQPRIPSTVMSDRIRWASSGRRLCEDDDPGESGSVDFRGEAAANSGEACNNNFYEERERRATANIGATNGAQRRGRQAATTHAAATFSADRTMWLCS